MVVVAAVLHEMGGSERVEGIHTNRLKKIYLDVRMVFFEIPGGRNGERRSPS